jgi:hypothetical protein
MGKFNSGTGLLLAVLTSVGVGCGGQDPSAQIPEPASAGPGMPQAGPLHDGPAITEPGDGATTPPDGAPLNPAVLTLDARGIVQLGGESFDLSPDGDSFGLQRQLFEIAAEMRMEHFYPEAEVGPLLPAEWLQLELADETPYLQVARIFELLMEPDIQVNRVAARTQAGVLYLVLPRVLGTSLSDSEPGQPALLVERAADGSPAFAVGSMKRPALEWHTSEEDQLSGEDWALERGLSFRTAQRSPDLAVALGRYQEVRTKTFGALPGQVGLDGLLVRSDLAWGDCAAVLAELDSLGWIDLVAGVRAPVVLERTVFETLNLGPDEPELFE